MRQWKENEIWSWQMWVQISSLVIYYLCGVQQISTCLGFTFFQCTIRALEEMIVEDLPNSNSIIQWCFHESGS